MVFILLPTLISNPINSAEFCDPKVVTYHFKTYEEAYKAAYPCVLKKHQEYIETKKREAPQWLWGKADDYYPYYCTQGSTTPEYRPTFNVSNFGPDSRKTLIGYHNLLEPGYPNSENPKSRIPRHRCGIHSVSQVASPKWTYDLHCKHPFYALNGECVTYCPSDAPHLDLQTGQCYSDYSKHEPEEQCEFNPIRLNDGNKIQVEVDHIIQAPFPIQISRTYRRQSSRTYQRDRNRKLFNAGKPNEITGVKHSQPKHFQKINEFGPAGSENYKYGPLGLKHIGYLSWDFNIPMYSGLPIRFHIDGKVDSFNYDSEENKYHPIKRDHGYLRKLESHPIDYKKIFEYISNNGEIYIFGSRSITSKTNRNGFKHNYLVEGSKGWKIEDEFGNWAKFNTTSEYKVTSVETSDDVLIEYLYDPKYGNLIEAKITKVVEDLTSTTIKKYHYGDDYDLVSITDENNVPFASWKYDEHGRAIESAHVNGGDLGTILYGENSVTTTNSLGKSTTYHYEVIHGAKRLVNVEGHQSEHCQAANKQYTYYESGKIKTQTDWNGNVTYFEYSDLGDLTKQVFAYGSPDAYSITYEWDEVFKKIKSITYPKYKETYKYDASGRLIKTTTSALNNQ